MITPKMFVAEVRDIKSDPWKSGRVKLRVYGHHDNEKDIKDEHLMWGMPLQDITSAATNRVGTSPTGMLVGSRVIGFFLDEECQYPVILGSFARAGKLKDEKDNTGGKDDIDSKHSDIPLAAVKDLQKTNTQAKKTTEQQKEDPTKESKYNKKDYVSEDQGKDAVEEARKKYAKKTMDLGTVGSLDKKDDSNILEKILKVDPQNKAGALKDAPRLFKQLLSMATSGGLGGAGSLGSSMSGLLGSGLGQMFQQIAGGGLFSGFMGGNSPLGTLGFLNNISRVLGGQQITGGLSFENASGLIIDLLNQLSGVTTPNPIIAALEAWEKEVLYNALLYVLRNMDDRGRITSVPDNRIPGPEVRVSPIVALADVPVGYLQFFPNSDTDPYPGYIRFDAPDESRSVYVVRPFDRPFAADQDTDTRQAGIVAALNELFNLIRSNTLTLERLRAIIARLRDLMAERNDENNLGQGMGQGNQNSQSNMMSLLGQLGQLVQQAQSMHLPESVLDQTKIGEVIKDFTKKASDVRRKKEVAKKAVAQKNTIQDT